MSASARVRPTAARRGGSWLALRLTSLLLLSLGGGHAWAQAAPSTAPPGPPARPSEDDMFGAPAATPPSQAPPSTRGPAAGAGAPAAGETPASVSPIASPAASAPATTASGGAASASGGAAAARDEAIMGGGPGPAAGDTAPQNPLTIGGQFYLRSVVSATDHQDADQWALSAPSLMDGYLDARPNERVRGMLVGRMRFDPTVDPKATSAFGTTRTAGPSVLLDQFWIRFDILQTVFVTAGRQHTRWGTGRFWQPTDFLHPVPRDPLAVFDERTGVTYLKLHLPWEQRGWNVYAVGLVEGVEPASTVGKVGGAARAEVVLGASEIGVDVLAQRGQKPRVGLDASFGLGDFDLYVDAGLRAGSEVQLWQRKGETDWSMDLPSQFEAHAAPTVAPQVTGGLTWSMRYNDNDVFTLGAEGFYNSLGSDDAKVYPWLIVGPQLYPAMFKGGAAFTPFYVGRRYAALFATLPAPYSWDKTTFTLSTLGNLSDRSFITRFDYSLIVLTHLRFEAFAAADYGQRGGELRFGIDIPKTCPLGMPTCADADKRGVTVNAPLFSAGLALRIAI